MIENLQTCIFCNFIAQAMQRSVISFVQILRERTHELWVLAVYTFQYRYRTIPRTPSRVDVVENKVGILHS